MFHQCIKQLDGSVLETPLCCPNGTLWQQDHLACVIGDCGVEVCPTAVPYTTGIPCPFWDVPGNPKQYEDMETGEILTCPDGTVFNLANCTCVHGGTDPPCREDPLMHWPFAHHSNDIMCHHVVGTLHGDAELVGGYLKVDGDGDYLSFGFLNNWFAWREKGDFTISMWFNQTQAGWDNTNNFPIEGLFGNGDCDQDPSVWMGFGNETQQGGVRTDKDEALFGDFGADKADRFYIEPLIWCQVAIRCTDTDVTLFLNGEKTGMRPISGNIVNTFAASTMGLTYLGCEPFFFSGCIDDVMIFDRYVPDAEMMDLFNRFRTPAGIEGRYFSAFYP